MCFRFLLTKITNFSRTKPRPAFVARARPCNSSFVSFTQRKRNYENETFWKGIHENHFVKYNIFFLVDRGEPYGHDQRKNEGLAYRTKTHNGLLRGAQRVIILADPSWQRGSYYIQLSFHLISYNFTSLSRNIITRQLAGKVTG